MYYSRRIRARSLRFEWDTANVEHIAIHDVRPWQAESAVGDQQRRSRYLGWIRGERRVFVVGRGGRRVLQVTLAPRGRGVFRVVTAYPAGREQMEWYREGLMR